MPIYRGVSGVNRKIITNIYRGANGVNREIQEQYRGVSGVNRAVHQSAWEGFTYRLGTDLTNASKLVGDMVELEYDDSDYTSPYITLYPPETVTIESLSLSNVKAYNYQANPNKNKKMHISVSSSTETNDDFYYVDSNVNVYRNINCINNVDNVLSPTNGIRIRMWGDEHRENVAVVCAVINIPNKSIILNGRPIDFTKMTVK